MIVASELAQRGASVTIVDCDPNRGALDWSRLPGVPASLDVVGDGVTEETRRGPRSLALIVVGLSKAKAGDQHCDGGTSLRGWWARRRTRCWRGRKRNRMLAPMQPTSC